MFEKYHKPYNPKKKTYFLYMPHNKTFLVYLGPRMECINTFSR